MKSKAIWFGLLGVGVADWLLLNLAVAPAYLASLDATQSLSGATQSPSNVTPSASAKPTMDAPYQPAGGPSVGAGSRAISAPSSPSGAPPAESASTSRRTPVPHVDAAPPAGPPPETLGPFHFSRRSSELSNEALRNLAALSEYLRRHPDMSLRIEGHADRLGKPEFNHWLSQQRARAVRAYLHEMGVPLERMRIEAYGSSRPADESGTEDGRAMNRRVELSVGRER